MENRPLARVLVHVNGRARPSSNQQHKVLQTGCMPGMASASGTQCVAKALPALGISIRYRVVHSRGRGRKA